MTNGGRYTGTTVSSYTFTSAETLIFAVPDYALSDNNGTLSVLDFQLVRFPNHRR